MAETHVAWPKRKFYQTTNCNNSLNVQEDFFAKQHGVKRKFRG